MDIILKENLANLGKIGEVVRVADGYARNFLLPRKLAVEATSGNKKIAAAQEKAVAARQAGLRTEAETLKAALEAQKLQFEREAGEEDAKLFGSVTAKEIAEQLTLGGHPIDKRKIILGQPLKTLGAHPVQVWLHPDVTATLTVEIVKR